MHHLTGLTSQTFELAPVFFILIIITGRQANWVTTSPIGAISLHWMGVARQVIAWGKMSERLTTRSPEQIFIAAFKQIRNCLAIFDNGREPFYQDRFLL